MKKNTETYAEESSSGNGDSRSRYSLWQIFSSMKTAIALLLVLAAASILGTVPAVGLEDVYHTKWYAFLIALIGINLAVCSVNRFGVSWRRTFMPKISVPIKSIAGMEESRKLTSPYSIQEAGEQIKSTLRARRYCVLEQLDGNALSLYATKGRVHIWGPYLTHLSLLLIFFGAVLGERFGFDGVTMIPEGGRVATFYPKIGKTVGEAKKLGFSVGLSEFKIEHDKNHNPTAFKSNLQVYEGYRQVASKVIDVNHPLSYGGVSLLQMDYEMKSLIFKIVSPDGQVKRVPFEIETKDTAHGKTYQAVESLKEIPMGNRKLTVYVHTIAPDYIGGKQINASFMPVNPAVLMMVNDRYPEHKEMNDWTPINWLPVTKSTTYKGFKITLEKAVNSSILEVSSNPGLPIIYEGFAMIVLGIFISFYIPHRTMRIRIMPSEKGSSVIMGATNLEDASTTGGDFDRLRDVLNGAYTHDN